MKRVGFCLAIAFSLFKPVDSTALSVEGAASVCISVTGIADTDGRIQFLLSPSKGGSRLFAVAVTSGESAKDIVDHIEHTFGNSLPRYRTERAQDETVCIRRARSATPKFSLKLTDMVDGSLSLCVEGRTSRRISGSTGSCQRFGLAPRQAFSRQHQLGAAPGDPAFLETGHDHDLVRRLLSESGLLCAPSPAAAGTVLPSEGLSNPLVWALAGYLKASAAALACVTAEGEKAFHEKLRERVHHEDTTTG